jgi:hypothetical protein
LSTGEISSYVAADNDAGGGVVEGLASRPVCFLLSVLTLIHSVGILVVLVLIGRSFLLSGVSEMVIIGTVSLLDTLNKHD